MAKRTLGIIDCDELAPELREDYDSYGRMFTQLLEPVAVDWDIKRYPILDGVWPESVEECDAYLLTGSKTGVYDDQAWLRPLGEFVRSAFDRALPLIGICFGHQFLANTLGGRAEKSSKGWGVGIRQVFANALPKWMAPQKDVLNLLYSHQDQVTELPPGATCLYGDAFCQYAAFHIENRVLAFQGHPEFTKPYMAGLMKLRKDRYAPGQYEEAVSSLEQDEQGDIVAKWIFQFLERAEVERGE